MDTFHTMCRRAMCIGVLMLGAVGTAAGQSVRYVDDSAPSGGDGLSWNTAYTDLQAALSAAAASGNPRASKAAASGGATATARRDPRSTPPRARAIEMQSSPVLSTPATSVPVRTVMLGSAAMESMIDCSPPLIEKL